MAGINRYAVGSAVRVCLFGRAGLLESPPRVPILSVGDDLLEPLYEWRQILRNRLPNRC